MAFFKKFQEKWLKKSAAPSNLWGPTYGYSYRQRLGYEDAFELVAWVQRAVRVIATNIQQVQVRAMTRTRTRAGIKLKPLPDEHPYNQLLQYPNDEEDMSGLLESTATHLSLRGEALWEVEGAPGASKGGSGNPTRIFNYPPQFINRAIIDSNKYVGYELIVNSHKFTIPDEDACFFKYYNPRNPWRGLGPMAAAFQAAETDYSAAKYNSRWFNAAPAPGVVIKYSSEAKLGSVTPEQRERLRTEIQRLYGGVDKAHGVMVLGPGQDVDKVGEAIKDMSFSNLRKFGRDEILACFGVPGIMAGVIEDVNRANGAESRAMFWEETMLPIVADISGMVNRKISPRFGPNVYAHFDTAGVAALRKNMSALTEWLLPTVDAGVLTINEARTEYFEKPPVPWGDDWYRASNTVETDGDEDAADGVPGEGKGDKKKPAAKPAAEPVDDEDDDENEDKQVQPSQIRGILQAWKNDITQRIRSGATTPLAAFQPGRASKAAARKFKVPKAATWQLASRVFSELSLSWEIDCPADGAAEMFSTYLEQLPKEDVPEKE